MKNVKLEKVKLKNNNYDVFVNVYNQFDLDVYVKKVLIICHGFDSKKDGSTTRYFSDNIDDMVLVSFDFPMHGDSDEPLSLENCINDLKIVDEYVRNRYSNANVGLFGTSFGAYIILSYLRQTDLTYGGIILKSPAIKMDKVFREKLLEEDIDVFKDRGYTIKNRNKLMKIYYSFYESLVNEKITADNIEKNRNIVIFHGTNDDVALFDDLKEYNFSNIQINPMDGSTHNLSDNDLNVIIKTINSIN